MKDIRFEIARRDSYVMPSHEVHSEIEVYYLTHGERLYFVENRTYHLKTGSVMFISSNRIHKTSAYGDEPHERMLLEVNPAFIEECGRQFSGLSFRYLLSRSSLLIGPENPCSAAIRQLFEEIRVLEAERPVGYEAEICCNTLKIFLQLERSSSRGLDESVVLTSTNQKIYEIADYMSQHMDSIASLEELAQHFFISKYYLCHKFREVTGLSVIAFLNMIRVQRAKVLLSENNLSVAQIAVATGCTSVARFTEIFRRLEGVTPHEYRKKYADNPWSSR